MTRIVARKTYRNGGWGIQSASLQYDDGLIEGGFRVSRPHWIVAAWDRWAHDTLSAAKAHYRAIADRT